MTVNHRSLVDVLQGVRKRRRPPRSPPLSPSETLSGVIIWEGHVKNALCANMD